MKRFIIVLVILSFVFLAGCAANDGKYTVAGVLERCGLAGCDEFSEDGNTFYYQKIDKVNCTYIVIIDENNAYSGYGFYIYGTERAAGRELERRKDSFFEEEDLVLGDNYANGWLAGVEDASIKVFDYLSRNMIIEVRDENIGSDSPAREGWYEEYYSAEAVKEREESANRIHAQIMSEW